MHIEDFLGELRQRWKASGRETRLGIAIAAIAAIVAVGYLVISSNHATVVTLAAAASEPQQTAGRRILYYRNAMNPSDTSPVPKKDSMGMDYVPVYSDEVSKTPGMFHVSTQMIQRTGVLTGTVRRMHMVNLIRSAGTVAADESKQAILNARFDGFIDKLYVSTTGAQVRAGQPLARVWIQSPEVLVKEADLVGSLQAKAGNHARLAANILRQYGVPQSVIAEIERTGVPTRTIPIVAPLNGTVMEKPAVEGMHFAAGDTLFKTADLSTVWVLAQVSERDLVGLKPGQMADIMFRDNPGQSFQGKVAFIYPEVNPDTRTTQVRIVVANPDGDLRVGEYADVTINVPISPNPVLAVPESAIMDDGTHQMAFLALPGGTFEARKVTVGARANGYDEILSGLHKGDRIVISGNFLIDAESNLQTAIQTMSGSSK